jgi:hypothetical protein
MSCFETTRWSLIRRSRGDGTASRGALAELCRVYEAPVRAYLSKYRVPGRDTADLAQGFFAELLASSLLDRAAQERGSFRAYLLGALKRYVGGELTSALAEKRGAGHVHVALDAAVLLADDTPTPEAAFHQAWIDAVLARALAALRDEAERGGRGALYERLAEYLLEPPPREALVALGAELGMRPNTLAVAVHRLRERFRALVRAELAQTATTAEQVEAELALLRA